MEGLKEGQVRTIGEISAKHNEELKRRHERVVETYLVELMRHPSLSQLRPEEIRLVVRQKIEDCNCTTFEYGIEIQRKAR